MSVLPVFHQYRFTLSGLQNAGMYCLAQLLQSSVHKRHVDKSKDDSCIQFYDNLKSPFVKKYEETKYCSGDDGIADSCQPEYMAEEICKSLLILYHNIGLETEKYQTSESTYLLCF